jgi:hypothetical protein
MIRVDVKKLKEQIFEDQESTSCHSHSTFAWLKYEGSHLRRKKIMLNVG